MTLIHLGIRAAVLLGLTAAFLVMVLSGLSRYTRPTPSSEEPPTPVTTPAPTLPQLPTPTTTPSATLIYLPTPLPPQDQVCNGADPPPTLTEINILSPQGDIITRIYCSGSDLKYVTSLDHNGVVERTYLFQDGNLRVKLYHSDGEVVKREDFDEEGNLVPDGTYINLPNSRIGPGLEATQP